MQAQSDEIALCVSNEAEPYVWTKGRKSFEDGTQMHNKSPEQGDEMDGVFCVHMGRGKNMQNFSRKI
jgi:hypothetical protein